MTTRNYAEQFSSLLLKLCLAAFACACPDVMGGGSSTAPVKITKNDSAPHGAVGLTITYPNDFKNRMNIFACTGLSARNWALVCVTNTDPLNNFINWTDADSANYQARFYQIRNADYDTDGDGLPDCLEELVYHTDPTKADTDGDGLSDWFEVNRPGIIVWGNKLYGQGNIPFALSNQATAIASGSFHCMGLRPNGEVFCWGSNSYGQTNVPGGLTGVVAMAGGVAHSMALKRDGNVICWGRNYEGQTNVPAGATGVVAIAAGLNHCLALKNDGTVISWGAHTFAQTNVPAGLTGVVAIAGGNYHSMALKSDGNIVCWGLNTEGQANVPAGISGVVAIAAGDNFSMALKNSGKVVCWGTNNYGQVNVPTGLAGVVAIAAGASHCMALKNDGRVVCWGLNSYGQTNVPASVTGTLAIAAGDLHSIALVATPSLRLNPLSRDTDGDDMPDGYEILHGLDPLVNDALRDPDSDGLKNLQEFQHSTNPWLADTDGDGMGDATEILMGFDPTVSNSFSHIPYTEDFNLVAQGDLNGWKGWTSAVPGSVVAEATNVHGGTFALELKPLPATARVSHAVAAMGVQGVQESYYIKPVRWPAGEQPGTPDATTAVDWYIENSGHLVVRDGSIWRTLNDMPVIPETRWVKVTTKRNYISRIWAIWIDDLKYVDNLAFANPLREYSGFTAYGSKYASVYIDDIAVEQCSPSEADPDALADVTNLHVDEMGYGWVKMAWTASASSNATGYKMQISKLATKTGDPIESGELIDIGNVTSATVSNEPGYYYTVEIHVYDALGNMTHTTIRTFGQNMGGITSAKCIWNDTGPLYLPVATIPSASNPYTFITGSCSVSNDGLFFVAGDVDALGGVSVDDELWLNPNNSGWVKLMGFGLSPVSNITQYVTEQQNNLEFKAVDTQGRMTNGTPCTCCSASDLYLVSISPALVPDFNHDRKIDDTDKSELSTKGPFRFWINDDNDSGDTGGDDIPGSSSPNCGNLHVDGTRDFVDFFPVWVNIKDTLNVLPPADYKYILKQAGGALNGMLTNLKHDSEDEASRPDAYLKSATWAKAHSSDTLKNVPAEGAEFDESNLELIRNGLCDGIMLFEAKSATTSPLVLEIRRKTDDQLMLSKEMPLSISSVTEMYRTVNLRNMESPGTIGAPANNPDSLSNGKNFVFLHGYQPGTDANWPTAWLSETFKRFYWSGSKAKFHGVSWNSCGSPGTAFQQAVVNAFSTAPALKAYVAGLSGEKIIAAHSLGNVVVSSAITDADLNMSVSKYMMCDAAVASEAYDATIAQTSQLVNNWWTEYDPKTWAANWYARFQDTGDSRTNLTWRNRFKKVVTSTEAWNFFSDGDEVFSLTDSPSLLSGVFYINWWFIIPTGYNPPNFGRYSWQKQELFKGTTYTDGLLGLGGTPHAGWGFNSATPFPNSEGKYEVHPAYTVAQANAATDAQLRTTPVFASYPNWLVSANALSKAQINEMLGMGIPALTSSTGITLIPSLGGQRQVNLNTTAGVPSGYKPNGWPDRGRPDYQSWLHNDIKDVAYLFTYKFFDKAVEIGDLK